MGYTVTIRYQPRPKKPALTVDEVILLADFQARIKGLKAECPTCGAPWVHDTAVTVRQEQDWTITYRCPNGDA